VRAVRQLHVIAAQAGVPRKPCAPAGSAAPGPLPGHGSRSSRSPSGAAPVVFEFPFDLVIMTRIYPAAPDPALYWGLALVAFLAELTTLALLSCLCGAARRRSWPSSSCSASSSPARRYFT
jgi:hypothetical protein